MKHKQALKAEIAMWRKNAKEPDDGDYQMLIMSEWPLCKSAGDECDGCPVAEYAGKRHCWGSPSEHAQSVWKGYIDGDVDKPTLSKALTAAADWLEKEVLK